MATRKPRIEYRWTFHVIHDDYVITWRMFGANGELMCLSSQGHRDKTDARRAVESVCRVLNTTLEMAVESGMIREVGPGKKPQS